MPLGIDLTPVVEGTKVLGRVADALERMASAAERQAAATEAATAAQIEYTETYKKSCESVFGR